jgi:hypothetical protein
MLIVNVPCAVVVPSVTLRVIATGVTVDCNGEPVIAPVDEFRNNPAGSDAGLESVHFNAATPPDAVIGCPENAVPTVIARVELTTVAMTAFAPALTKYHEEIADW